MLYFENDFRDTRQVHLHSNYKEDTSSKNSQKSIFLVLFEFGHSIEVTRTFSSIMASSVKTSSQSNTYLQINQEFGERGFLVSLTKWQRGKKNCTYFPRISSQQILKKPTTEEKSGRSRNFCVLFD